MTDTQDDAEFERHEARRAAMYAREEALRAAVTVATSDNGPDVYDAQALVDMAKTFSDFLTPQPKDPA